MRQTKNLSLNIHDEPYEANENEFDYGQAIADNLDKIDEFAGTVNEKTEKLEGDISSQGADITSLKVDTSNLAAHKYHMKITEGIQAEGELTLPCKYKVGSDCLDVYYLGERLVKDDTEKGIEGHYQEIGETGQTSNKIKVGWNVEASTEEDESYFDFVVRGEHGGE